MSNRAALPLSLKPVPSIAEESKIEGPEQAPSDPPSTKHLWENAQAIYRSFLAVDQRDIDPLMKRLKIALQAEKAARCAGIDPYDFAVFALDAYAWLVAWSDHAITETNRATISELVALSKLEEQACREPPRIAAVRKERI